MQRQHNTPIGATPAGYFSILPEELNMYILSFLNVRELASVERVSRYWRRLAEVPTHPPSHPGPKHHPPSWWMVPLRRAECNVTVLFLLLICFVVTRSISFLTKFGFYFVFLFIPFYQISISNPSCLAYQITNHCRTRTGWSDNNGPTSPTLQHLTGRSDMAEHAPSTVG